MIQRDLAFIREHVTVWPEDAISVRLDEDGEICFGVKYEADFYPEGQHDTHYAFVGAKGCGAIGNRYTREEWAVAMVTMKKGLQPGLSILQTHAEDFDFLQAHATGRFDATAENVSNAPRGVTVNAHGVTLHRDAATQPDCTLHPQLRCPKRNGATCTDTKPCINKAVQG